MRYDRFAPSESLKKVVKEFWVFEDSSTETRPQKIIPDGYSEIIIHYGDPYEVNLSGHWETQSPLLFSSQIRQYFYLRNTGSSGMIGIKLHPVSFYELFQIDLSGMTGRVVNLLDVLPTQVGELRKQTNTSISVEDRIQSLENWLISQPVCPEPSIRKSIDAILAEEGNIEVESLASMHGISARQLERKFKKMIGLSPKFYSRIIRFSTIFKRMESGDESWVRIALQSGYFDQSHFIKNFQEFAGDDPSVYGFNETTLANFFLKG